MNSVWPTTITKADFGSHKGLRHSRMEALVMRDNCIAAMPMLVNWAEQANTQVGSGNATPGSPLVYFPAPDWYVGWRLALWIEAKAAVATGHVALAVQTKTAVVIGAYSSVSVGDYGWIGPLYSPYFADGDFDVPSLRYLYVSAYCNIGGTTYTRTVNAYTLRWED